MKCIAILAFAIAALCVAEIAGDCVPGLVYMEDCNTCHCSADGKVAACTLMACPPHDAVQLNQKIMCEPGLTWKKDCNTCICTSNGVGICTQMACL